MASSPIGPAPRKKPHQLPLPSTSFNAPSSPRLPISQPKPVSSKPAILAGEGSANGVSPSPSTAAMLSPGVAQVSREGTPSPVPGSSASPRMYNKTPLFSMTHAGGIQPPASFFRPSRPDQVDRRSSGETESSQIRAPDPGTFQLSPLTPVRTRSSENLSLSTHGRESMSTDELQRQFSVAKRIKHSREPLLPLANVIREGQNAPSIGRSSSEHQHPVNRIDKLLRRQLSIDSEARTDDSSGVPVEESNRQTSLDQPTQNQAHSAQPSFNIGTPSQHGNTSHMRELKTPIEARTFSFEPNSMHKLSAVPLIAKDGRTIKNWQLHQSQNKFFFGGNFLTGGDSPLAFIASFILCLAISGVWIGTTAIWWWFNITPAVAIIGAYLILVVVTTMLATATQDPGILPRNLDLNPPYPSHSPSHGSTAPLPRDLNVRTTTVRVKYCVTCRTYRPPRSSHCKMCDNCVEDCDHHCQWVNNCVGRRNYTSFFAFLTSAVISLILVIVTSALHIGILCSRDGYYFGDALSHAIGSAVVFCLAICVIWPVAALLMYHMRLLLLNITTIEQIRNQAHKSLVPGAAPPNPFTYGSWRRNLIEVMCRPQGASWLNPTAPATEDKRLVNPANVEQANGDHAGTFS